MDMDELELPGYEMDDIIIGNEHLDRKPVSTASKARSYKASVSKNQGKESCRVCFTSITCLAVLLSLLIALGAVALAAVGYINQSEYQNEFDKLSSRVSELTATTEGNITQLRQQQNNASQDTDNLMDRINTVNSELNARITNDINALHRMLDQATNMTVANLTQTFNLLSNFDGYLRALMSNFTSLSNQLNQIASETQNSNASLLLRQLDASIQEKVDALESRIIADLPLILNCGAGEWFQVAHLNMYNRTEKCPAVWREYNASGLRACGRPTTTQASCPGTSYVTGRQYSRVCGRVVGYQEDSPDGFVNSNANNASQSYLDGVSITYGSSRQHLWSYVAGVTEDSISHTPNNCPCSTQAGTGPPSFVGNNYYCESGNPSNTGGSPMLLTNDPLWDGHQCEGSCCSGTNSPPWFSVQLPAPTMDTIEVRICGNEGTDNEDTPVVLLDLYVQ